MLHHMYRVWTEQPVFKTTELGNEAVEALRNRGYVLLRLDEDTGGRLERLYDGMEQFFDLNPSQKNMWVIRAMLKYCRQAD